MIILAGRGQIRAICCRFLKLTKNVPCCSIILNLGREAPGSLHKENRSIMEADTGSLVLFFVFLLLGALVVLCQNAAVEVSDSRLRRRVCENFPYLGLAFDYEANTAWGVDTVISLPDSKVKVALVTTDEELVIARDTMHLVQSMDE